MPKSLTESEKILLILGQLIKESSNLDKALRSYLKHIRRSLGLGRLSLMLFDEVKAELFVKEALGLKLEIRQKARVGLGEGIAGWVAKERKPLLIRNIENHPRFRTAKKASGFRSGSFLSVPVKTAHKFFGVLNGAEKDSGRPISEAEAKTFQILADVLALFLENQGFRDQVEGSEKMRLDEMADISHEFRIPLTCLKEALAILKDGIPGTLNEKQKRYLEMAERNILRMTRLVDVLLQRIPWMNQGPLLNLQRKKLNAAEWAEDILREFTAIAEKRKIQLRFECPNRHLTILADPERLGEVVMNFLDNAIKYSKPETEVLLKMIPADGKMRLSVEDYGEGIPKEEQGRIFNRAYRLKAAKEKKIEGQGLGLALGKEIVEAHGGTISVESEEGKGSSFWFELPLQS